MRLEGALALTPAAVLPLTGVRAVVVDDNATSRRVIHEILSSQGVEVSHATTGHEAITQLMPSDENGTRYQLLLLDSNLPHASIRPLSNFQLAVEKILSLITVEPTELPAPDTTVGTLFSALLVEKEISNADPASAETRL